MGAEIKMLQILNVDEADAAISSVGADPGGVAIMREKAVFRVLRLAKVPIRAAIIIKQTFLAHGAEAAVSQETAGLSAENTDMILMGTLAQYKIVLAKLRQQPFGLRSIAEGIEKKLLENP